MQSGIPKAAAVAINDLLDHCARVKPGQEVLLLAHIDGLYGSDNLVDENAISWIQTGIHERGANASVLWIDETAKVHAWRIPPVVKAAITACDIIINHSFDIVVEEIMEFREHCEKQKNLVMLRNFATTARLLCTAWAQTPYELVSEIRYQASLAFKAGLKWKLTDENGTHLEGVIEPPSSWAPPYTSRREEAGNYRPWPEWLHAPIAVSNTSGVLIFDIMHSWWSRYIGISPYFNTPIKLTIENCRIVKIEGGSEADALRKFLAAMHERLGEGVYAFTHFHSGVHPQAFVEPHQCPSLPYRRIIEHAHSSNIHFHIGAPPAIPSYNYWMHCTGDIRTATLKVGNTLVHDRGHLTALDHPKVLAVAKKYPNRPGL